MCMRGRASHVAKGHAWRQHAPLFVENVGDGVKSLSGGMPRKPFFSAAAVLDAGDAADSGDAKNAPPASRLARLRSSTEPICCTPPTSTRLG